MSNAAAMNTLIQVLNECGMSLLQADTQLHFLDSLRLSSASSSDASNTSIDDNNTSNASPASFASALQAMIASRFVSRHTSTPPKAIRPVHGSGMVLFRQKNESLKYLEAARRRLTSQLGDSISFMSQVPCRLGKSERKRFFMERRKLNLRRQILLLKNHQQ